MPGKVKGDPFLPMLGLGIGLAVAAIVVALVGVFTLPSDIWGWPAGILWSAAWLCFLLAGPVTFFWLKWGR